MSSIKDRLFKTKEGDYVYGQSPNWPIWAYVGLRIVEGLTKKQITLNAYISVLGSLALIYWAALEIFTGVNLFRRLLGSALIMLAIWGVWQQLSSGNLF